MTRSQIENWVESDYRVHFLGIQKTLRHLISIIDAEPTPGGDGCYCTHHPDDPAHGDWCY